MVKNLTADASDLRDVASLPGSGISPGDGNGNPFQHCCLGNHRDRGAWGATVLGVTKSQTRLSTRTLNRGRTGQCDGFVHVFSSNNPPPANEEASYQGPWKEYKDENAVEKCAILWGRLGLKEHRHDEMCAKQSTCCGNAGRDEISSDWESRRAPL